MNLRAKQLRDDGRGALAAGDEPVDAEAPCADDREEKRAEAEDGDKFPASGVNKDFCSCVDVDKGAHHVDEQQHADHGHEHAGEERDAAAELDDDRERRRHRGCRDAHRLEGVGLAAEAVLGDLLPAVGDEDDAEDYAESQKGEVAERRAGAGARSQDACHECHLKVVG